MDDYRFTLEEAAFIIDAVKAFATNSKQRELAERIHTKLDMMRARRSE